MKLSEFKNILQKQDTIAFELPNGQLVPNHFHVTEVGAINKKFIDCGGTLREENTVGLQLWEANDYDHRLHPEKLINILELSERKLSLEDHEIEVEYQGQTIGKYGLGFNGRHFTLTNQTTDCLAKDKCGIPVEKLKVNLSELNVLQPAASSCCTPGGGCC